MKELINRLEKEKKKLEIKSTKLKYIIILNEEFLKVDELSRSLLQVQDNVMDAYISILDLRIKHLKEMINNESD